MQRLTTQQIRQSLVGAFWVSLASMAMELVHYMLIRQH